MEALKEEAPHLASDLIEAGRRNLLTHRLSGIEVSIKWRKEELSFNLNEILGEYPFI